MAQERANAKGDTGTRIKCRFATMRKALNYRENAWEKIAAHGEPAPCGQTLVVNFSPLVVAIKHRHPAGVVADTSLPTAWCSRCRKVAILNIVPPVTATALRLDVFPAPMNTSLTLGRPLLEGKTSLLALASCLPRGLASGQQGNKPATPGGEMRRRWSDDGMCFLVGGLRKAASQRQFLPCFPHAKILVTPPRFEPAVSLLASHQGEPGSIPAGPFPDFRMWETCRPMPLFSGFSRGSPVFPALSFGRCLILTSITLIGLSVPRCKMPINSSSFVLAWSALLNVIRLDRGLNENILLIFGGVVKDMPKDVHSNLVHIIDPLLVQLVSHSLPTLKVPGSTGRRVFMWGMWRCEEIFSGLSRFLPAFIQLLLHASYILRSVRLVGQSAPLSKPLKRETSQPATSLKPLVSQVSPFVHNEVYCAWRAESRRGALYGRLLQVLRRPSIACRTPAERCPRGPLGIRHLSTAS
ncbi:hypothetical protein PR048_028699 [Dryococelus australis]|uniref:Uncharacterized protein n=1 Tax=Dryococelus australis TaxID=614101 RepID=A0ABQ9GBB1_9NEOP|nr:hypothetical protein PR048_028699 [Dryococelus australis]